MIRVLSALVAVAMSVALCSSALADSINIETGDRIRLTNGPGESPGGEYIATKQTYTGTEWVDTTTTWSTFCLETNEHFTFGELLRVAGISNAAVNGGSGGPSPDPISDRTAWLYSQLQTGNLVGLNSAGSASSGSYLSNQTRNATYLQKAIWYLENETLGESNYYVTLATNAVNAGWTNASGFVKVLNLERWNGSSWVKAQDQLVYSVPEPATLALLASGIAGIVVAKRRRRLALRAR